MIGWLAAALAADGEPAWTREGLGFGGIPAVNYNTDEGLGLGVVGSVYRYDGKTSPYKVGVTAIFFATTRGVQNHRIDVDALQLAQGRLRLTSRVELDITRTNNFCGFGPDVTCDPEVAEGAADAAGLAGEDRERFVRRYYLASYIRPNGYVNGRWRLGDLSAARKVELMGSLRAAYHLPGDFSGKDPDPGSLISGRLEAEEGLLTVLQAGVMFDGRDYEPAPSRGVWTEASVRGATRYLGSDFDYAGVNLTFRGYVPLAGEGRLVGATRLALDGMVGDVPIREMAQMGGSAPYQFGGGLNAGRGIRQRRFLGRVKGLVQPELRWKFAHIEPFGVGVDLTALAFGDLLVVAQDWDRLDELGSPKLGQGAGLRVAFDDSFIIRVDTGFSQVEGWSPAIYIDLNHLY